MGDSLKDIYGVIVEKHKRDINKSTTELVKKAHPKSPVVLDLEAELFDLDPDEIKRLPMKAIEMLDKALKNLLKATDEDPMLRSALRKYVNKLFTKKAEKDEKGKDIKEGVELTEEQLMDEFKSLLTIFEAKATKFNYKIFLDIEPNKIMNPFFVQLLNTFGLVDLTRQQKQGVLLFLKKLAELSEGNPMIANALNKIVRLENQTEVPPNPTEGI